ncbi:hypothetical protein MMC08_004479 [Hypocenomyce scalaris]|nr:hypothetical protein [Hypocenomyce scalaris]
MALPLSPLSSSDQNLKTPTTVERTGSYKSPKSYHSPNKSVPQDAENDTTTMSRNPPSSPFVEVVDVENRSACKPRSPSKHPSPKKPPPERRDPIALTEDALRENEGLTRAIHMMEDEAANDGQYFDASNDTISPPTGGPHGYSGMDDTCFSTFSEVPDMTTFVRMGGWPTKSISRSPAKQLRETQNRNGAVTPSQRGRTTPGTTRSRAYGDSSRSPSPTPRRPKAANSADTTNLILDFTEQFNAFAPSSTGSPGREKRKSLSPIKFQPQREVSWGSRGRTPSPAKQMLPPGTPSESRYLANLLDFDIPPAPTPRSIPTISARELESLKSTFLSQISSLRATLNGKEVEINSLKEAVSDAERRVGEAFEDVRELRNAKESLQHQKADWDIREEDMHVILRNAKEEHIRKEREIERLAHSVEESDKRREEAESKLAEAESRVAALRAAAPSTPVGSETGASETGGNKEVEAAVEKVARELHSLYRGKHETKVAALKKSYEARWEKKIRDLETKVDEFSKENDELRLGRDATMSGVLPAPPAPVPTEWEKQLRAAESQRQEEERARLEAELEGLRRAHEATRGELERERVEKGELVAASEEMLSMLAQSAVVEHAGPAGGIENLRGSVSRASGLKGPGFGLGGESRIGRMHVEGRSGSGSGSGSRSGSGIGRSGIMSNIERMGRGRVAE